MRTEGVDALSKCKSVVDRHIWEDRKNIKPQSELERLRKENEELRLEVALLKKVRALVKERNARLQGIRHVTSKN